MENIEVKHLIFGQLGSTENELMNLPVVIIYTYHCTAFKNKLHRILFSVIGQVPQMITFPQISTNFPLLQDWPWWWCPTCRASGSWIHNSAGLEVSWNGTSSWIQGMQLQECRSNSSGVSRASLAFLWRIAQNPGSQPNTGWQQNAPDVLWAG